MHASMSDLDQMTITAGITRLVADYVLLEHALSSAGWRARGSDGHGSAARLLAGDLARERAELAQRLAVLGGLYPASLSDMLKLASIGRPGGPPASLSEQLRTVAADIDAIAAIAMSVGDMPTGLMLCGHIERRQHDAWRLEGWDTPASKAVAGRVPPGANGGH